MKAKDFFSKFILDYFNKQGIKLLISLSVEQMVKELAEMKRRIDVIFIVLIQFGGSGSQ